MLKSNYYRLFLLTVLFFNSVNVLRSSSNQQDSLSLPPFCSPPPLPVVNPTNSELTNSSECNDIRIYTAHTYDTEPEVTNEANDSPATSQSEKNSFPSIHQYPESSVSIHPLMPIRSVTPQPYKWHFNNFTNTLMPPFMLPGWDPNSSTNMFANNSNFFPPITHELIPSNTIHTNNNLTEQSSFSDIYQQNESSANSCFLFPLSSVTPRPCNCPNSSTNTFIPLGWDPNNSTNTFANIHNIISLPITHDNEDFNHPSSNTNNNPISSILPHPNQDKSHAHAEKKKKQKSKKKNKESTKAPTCPTCKKILSSQCALKQHVKTHDPNRPKPYQCHICPKSFTQKSVLKTHIKRHNKEKPFECDLCSKRFTTNGELIQHRRIHTGEKPFKCKYCYKCFTTNSTLTNHIRTHTGEKPYKCHICGRGLSSKRVLEGHLNKHNGKKPYKCKKCTKSYATKDGLKKHKREHNNSQQYTCHYCGVDFVHKSEYTSHMRYEEETNEDLICYPCQKTFADKYRLREHNRRKHEET